jgi:manganese-dependent inorganic pyrophosphatase
MRLSDPLSKLRGPLSRAPNRCLPIGDDEGRVAGVIFESDLIKEPNIEIIMVDHNEPIQAIEGIENYKILEVIDHHRLGNMATRRPIDFINKAVGATCTIITNLYREQNMTPERDIASLLLCGILSDTLFLHSATTTGIDREAAAWLSECTGLEINRLSQELQAAANQFTGRPAPDLIRMDMKEYNEQGITFSVSQIETNDTGALVSRREEILPALENVRTSINGLFSALLVTDVTALDSILFVAGKKSFLGHISFPRIDEGIYELKEIVSRKKQLLPLLSELVEDLAER